MSEPMRDEALEEIWAARRRVWEEAGGTWEGYNRRLDEVEAELKRQGVKFITEPLRRPLDPGDSAILREDPPE